jgi:hypothetical protein
MRSEGVTMSQEILFLIFMTCELFAIMALYTYWIIPRVSLATNNLFESRMLDKTWDIPAMLEDYTEHLAIVFSEIIKKLVPQVIGGYMSQGNQQLRADPENIMHVATADFLESLDPSARMVANMVLPRIKEALSKSQTSPKEVAARYSPGLDKP